MENFCDDCESEKRELVQAKLQHERKISSLEEKCRTKERELNELRDTSNELHICQIDNDKMKAEIQRFVTFSNFSLNSLKCTMQSFFRLLAELKSSQEVNEIVGVLKAEKDELIKKNIMLCNKVRSLCSRLL